MFVQSPTSPNISMVGNPHIQQAKWVSLQSHFLLWHKVINKFVHQLSVDYVQSTINIRILQRPTLTASKMGVLATLCNPIK
jgi:hypothetical protein